MTQEKVAVDRKVIEECIRAFSSACGVGCTAFGPRGEVLYADRYSYCASCGVCRAAGRRNDNCTQAHLGSAIEASRFGQNYIYLCPMGLSCFLSPVEGEGGSCGQLTAGPVLMMPREDYLSSELPKHLALTEERQEAVARALEEIPALNQVRAAAMSVLLSMTADFLAKISGREEAAGRRLDDEEREQLKAHIRKLRWEAGAKLYPFGKEELLLQAVRQGNRKEAHRLLNGLLGHALLSTGGELERIKARAYELLVLLGRAAIDGGADPEEKLCLNSAWRERAEKIRDFGELCQWLEREANLLIDSTLDFDGAGHTGVIQQSLQYINTHYARRLTLEEMARRAYLSPPYFSRIFREETGETFTACLNRVRVERSRELLRHRELRLADIALLVGFEDQSYFTKVFKKITGVPPLRYRDGLG